MSAPLPPNPRLPAVRRNRLRCYQTLRTFLGRFRRNILRQRPQLLFVEGLLILFISILLLTLVPWQQRFEAQVLATQLAFDVNLPQGESSRRFLNSIRNIEQINLKGNYLEALPLSGSFSGPGIGQQTELEIELPYEYSQLQLRPVENANAPVASELELKNLQLQDKAKIPALRYIPFNRRLELEFSHMDMPGLTAGSVLNIELGTAPLKLTLEGYRLPQLKLDDPDGNQPLSIVFTPDITDIDLLLPQQGSISLELPSLKDKDTFRWFWGGLPVSNVEFITPEESGTDFLERSSILQGKIRQGERTLDIEADQFLLAQNPGIQKLRYLQLAEKKGIEVRGVGQTTNIQVGLDPDFPIQGLRSNFLTRFLPADTAIAIISFAGAMIASLLVWLVDNLFKSPDADD